jgi:hypothetical protein
MISSRARDSQFTNCMSHSLEHALRVRCSAEERRASWLSLERRITESGKVGCRTRRERQEA